MLMGGAGTTFVNVKFTTKSKDKRFNKLKVRTLKVMIVETVKDGKFTVYKK